MSDPVERGGGNMGFVGALTLLFIALKLTGVIDWSWLWVLSPVPIGLVLAFFVMMLLLYGDHKGWW